MHWPGWLLVAAALGGYTATTGQPSEMPTTRHVVEISGMTFIPSVLEVHPGDSVTWINRDMVPHTATGVKRAAWNTGTLGRGDSSTVVMQGTGEQDYLCQLHPVMTGKLIVRQQ